MFYCNMTKIIIIFSFLWFFNNYRKILIFISGKKICYSLFHSNKGINIILKYTIPHYNPILNAIFGSQNPILNAMFGFRNPILNVKFVFWKALRKEKKNTKKNSF